MKRKKCFFPLYLLFVRVASALIKARETRVSLSLFLKVIWTVILLFHNVFILNSIEITESAADAHN